MDRFLISIPNDEHQFFSDRIKIDYLIFSDENLNKLKRDNRKISLNVIETFRL